MIILSVRWRLNGGIWQDIDPVVRTAADDLIERGLREGAPKVLLERCCHFTRAGGNPPPKTAAGLIKSVWESLLGLETTDKRVRLGGQFIRANTFVPIGQRESDGTLFTVEQLSAALRGPTMDQ